MKTTNGNRFSPKQRSLGGIHGALATAKKFKEIREYNYTHLPFEQFYAIHGHKRARQYILIEQQYKCLICKIDKWMNKTISLQLDHIDGNKNNNKRENLRCFCPNCHSQTSTFCSKNTKKHRRALANKATEFTFMPQR